ncbi:MAG: hypothetical protein GY952_20945 [Rhodobacteraceae bacterium]|nr:hypothetical protein [Paracoccaceae bacterium]
MVKIRNIFLVLAAVILSACGGKSVWAPDEAVEKYAYASDEQPYLLLKTMISNKSGAGGHSSLLINGSQVVMYDPAGRWHHSWAPERNDVVFGLSPALLKQYDSFHARDTHHVVSQKIYVSQEVAQRAMQAAFNMGPSMDAFCSSNTSNLLRQIPGFGGLKRTYLPAKLMKEFGQMPGVTTEKYYENDKGKN